jgi:hypothetical protein
VARRRRNSQPPCADVGPRAMTKTSTNEDRGRRRDQQRLRLHLRLRSNRYIPRLGPRHRRRPPAIPPLRRSGIPVCWAAPHRLPTPDRVPVRSHVRHGCRSASPHLLVSTPPSWPSSSMRTRRLLESRPQPPHHLLESRSRPPPADREKRKMPPKIRHAEASRCPPRAAPGHTVFLDLSVAFFRPPTMAGAAGSRHRAEEEQGRDSGGEREECRGLDFDFASRFIGDDQFCTRDGTIQPVRLAGG